jgi:hypothetical protein
VLDINLPGQRRIICASAVSEHPSGKLLEKSLKSRDTHVQRFGFLPYLPHRSVLPLVSLPSPCLPEAVQRKRKTRSKHDVAHEHKEDF